MRFDAAAAPPATLRSRAGALVRKIRTCHHPVFREQGNSLRGMGFEPMRFATTDLETVSLTTRTSSSLAGFKL